jgi:hypothetical protein
MDYDLGYIDLEQKTLQPLDNPFGHRVHFQTGVPQTGVMTPLTQKITSALSA